MSGGNHCLRHPSKPEYVAGERALGNYCHRGTEVGRGVCTFSPQRQSDWYFGHGLRRSAVRGWMVFFFSCAVLAVTRENLRRSRHLTDSIWRSICLEVNSVETGDRHCAYVTKPNIDSILGEPSWHRCHIWSNWSNWSSWPSWHRSEAEVKKETPGTMHYIYVALKQPKKIDALPCGYPPRPSR